MVHMAGHVYHRVGDDQKAHDAFVAATRVDDAYLQAEGLPHADNWNHAHNLSYLVANLAEAGRYADGLQWAARLQALGAADPTVTAHAHAFRDGLRLYARDMLEIDDRAERTSEALDALLWRLVAEQAVNDAADYHAAEVPPILTVAALELRGRLRSHQDRHPEAEALLRRAVEREQALNYNEPPVYPRPAAEVLGEALLRAGRPTDAGRLPHRPAATSPQRVRALRHRPDVRGPERSRQDRARVPRLSRRVARRRPGPAAGHGRPPVAGPSRPRGPVAVRPHKRLGGSGGGACLTLSRARRPPTASPAVPRPRRARRGRGR